MSNVELFNSCTDEELKKIFLNKTIDVIYNDNTHCSGVITGFFNSAQCEDSERKFVGIIINDEDQISITNLIKEINILK